MTPEDPEAKPAPRARTQRIDLDDLRERARGLWRFVTRRGVLRWIRDILLALTALFTLFSVHNLRAQFPRREFAVYPRLGGYYDYRGALCVHSDYSNGKASYGEIAQHAHDAGLDFVVVCDKGTMQARNDGKVGSYGDLFLFCGAELERPEGRLWFLGPTKMPASSGDPDAATATLLAELDDHLTVIAMPTDPQRPWTDLSLGGFDALEVVNLTSLWRRSDPWQWLAAASVNLIDGAGSLARLGIDRRPFLLWDELTRHRRVVGLSSVDVTGRTKVIGDWYIPTPDYPDALRFLQTHVLLPRRLPEEPREAFLLVNSALKAGHCYGSVAPIGIGSGFRFTARQGDSVAVMGDELVIDAAAGEPVSLEAYCPPAEGVFLTLLRDGEELLRSRDRRLTYVTSRPGVYRVEAWIKAPNLPFGDIERLWLYSNPIYLRLPES
jgi:hypothetical protein